MSSGRTPSRWGARGSCAPRTVMQPGRGSRAPPNGMLNGMPNGMHAAQPQARPLCPSLSPLCTRAGLHKALPLRLRCLPCTDLETRSLRGGKLP